MRRFGANKDRRGLQELNPQFVWGGDAITLDSTDKVWIDHCKFSLIGRQMIVSGWGAAGHVTISNNEFDGVTSWSAGCNGKRMYPRRSPSPLPLSHLVALPLSGESCNSIEVRC